MRILQISSAKNYGGGEKHLIDLSRGLRDKGHEVFVAVRPEILWDDKLDFLPAGHIFRLPMRNALDIFSARKLAQLMCHEKIEIVHAHLARDYPVASLAKRFFPETKLILTRHVLFPMSSLHRLTLGNVARVIAVSNAVSLNLQKTFPAEKIALIPNGIEIEKFADLDKEKLGAEFRRFHNISPDKKLIATLGELKKLKGQEDFVLAANEIAKKHPNTYFLVVGKDNSFDQSFRRSLKRLVKVFGLEEKFTFLDWVEDTAPMLSALDVFVSASHSESFGLAILEAMTSGTAIVSTATEGAKELLTDGVSGSLTPVANPVKLAEAISEILADAKKQKKFGANAQQFAKESFSLEKMIAVTAELYRSAL